MRLTFEQDHETILKNIEIEDNLEETSEENLQSAIDKLMQLQETIEQEKPYGILSEAKYEKYFGKITMYKTQIANLEEET